MKKMFEVAHIRTDPAALFRRRMATVVGAVPGTQATFRGCAAVRAFRGGFAACMIFGRKTIDRYN